MPRANKVDLGLLDKKQNHRVYLIIIFSVCIYFMAGPFCTAEYESQLAHFSLQNLLKVSVIVVKKIQVFCLSTRSIKFYGFLKLHFP